MKKTHRHITTTANNSINRGRAGVVVIWNDSSTIELTLTIPEVRKLGKQFFIDIEDIISDKLNDEMINLKIKEAIEQERLKMDEEKNIEIKKLVE
jgi:hypothetical protein